MMNCNNLTKKDAQAAWHDSELKKRWERSSLDRVERRNKYSAAYNDTPFIKAQGGGFSGSWIHDDFRGFLTNGEYIVYIGDDWKGWWLSGQVVGRVVQSWPRFGREYNEILRHWNGFGAPHLTDVTDQICKAKAPFMNWIDVNPLEVKG